MNKVVSSPAKLILFGEWAVMNGSVGIAAAVDGEMKISWKAPQTKRDDPAYLLRSQEGMTPLMALWDPAKPLDQQSQVPDFFKTSIQLAQHTLLSPHAAPAYLGGGEFQFQRSWPVPYGLGSSSAIAACFCELAFEGKSLMQKWQAGRLALQKTQSPRASGLDLAAQLKGGVVYLKNHEPRGIAIDIPKEIFVLHGGEKADTTDWITNKNPDAGSVQKMGTSAEAFLEHRDWIKAMDEHATAQENMDIWPQNLRKLRDEWLKAKKVVSMKSCGAGGGDAWMAWIDPDNAEALTQESHERGFTLKRYDVSAQGTKFQ